MSRGDVVEKGESVVAVNESSKELAASLGVPHAGYSVELTHGHYPTRQGTRPHPLRIFDCHTNTNITDNALTRSLVPFWRSRWLICTYVPHGCLFLCGIYVNLQRIAASCPTASSWMAESGLKRRLHSTWTTASSLRRQVQCSIRGLYLTVRAMAERVDTKLQSSATAPHSLDPTSAARELSSCMTAGRMPQY